MGRQKDIKGEVLKGIKSMLEWEPKDRSTVSEFRSILNWLIWVSVI